MSDRPHGEGWWLASDGRWYPPEAKPNEPLPPPPPGMAPAAGATDRPGSGLTTWVRVLFYVAGALALAGGMATINEILKFDAFFDGESLADLDALVDAEDLSDGILGFYVLAAIALAVLVMVWMHQAHRALARYGATGTRWSPGWAVGGWFIPAANLVIPKLVINEIDRVSSPESGPPPVAESWRSNTTMGLSTLWWALFVTGAVVVTIGSTITGGELERTDFDPDTYRLGLYAIAVGLLIASTAAVTGAGVFDRLGRRLRGE